MHVRPENLLDLAGDILVPGAGVVLAGPYLMRLWSMLGLVKEQVFVDSAAAERATHLMRFIVFGDTQADKPASAVNRLLCGSPIASAGGEMAATLTISAEERKAVDGMLAAMIAHWKVLGHTSIDGLRASFLQREGSLMRGEGGWVLAVQAGPFDMLLDQLPWGYATCKLPWMPEALCVSWR